MKKRLRFFAGAFCVTVIFLFVFGAMLYCENNAQMTVATEQSALLSVHTGGDTITLTLLGEQCLIDCTQAVRLERLRREYYYLMPMCVKLMEQAVYHSANELTALAKRAAE
ncbi:MAG: hypothetical protein ACERKO_04880 [Acetanaerobacterium sp.]